MYYEDLIVGRAFGRRRWEREKRKEERGKASEVKGNGRLGCWG